MARNAEQQKIFNKERYIGRKAAKMAQDYVLQRMKARLHDRGVGMPEEPLLEGLSVKAKMGDYRLLGLNLKSSRHGYILHHGFSGVRGATTVFLKAERYHKNATQRKSHEFDLPAYKIFEDIYQKSGAFDYLIKALGETRTNAIKVTISNLVINISNDKNGN